MGTLWMKYRIDVFYIVEILNARQKFNFYVHDVYNNNNYY